jgi:hypothetical protein
MPVHVVRSVGDTCAAQRSSRCVRGRRTRLDAWSGESSHSLEPARCTRPRRKADELHHAALNATKAALAGNQDEEDAPFGPTVRNPVFGILRFYVNINHVRLHPSTSEAVDHELECCLQGVALFDSKIEVGGEFTRATRLVALSGDDQPRQQPLRAGAPAVMSMLARLSMAIGV